ncbi:MAG: tetratricopeptide repeat protein [Calditrichaceae bacterium]
MREKLLSNMLAFVLVALLLLPPLYAQDATADMIRYNVSLKAYVDQMMDRFGEDAIRHERFIIKQMRMLNDEIKERVGSVPNIHRSYFDRLERRLSEVRELKDRLNSRGSYSLNNFIVNIEDAIDNTIKRGIVDFKKQKVIEEAVQLLYVAEEMIKLDPNAQLEKDPRFNAELSSTQSDFIDSFGKTGSAGKGITVKPGANIFDVYEAWRYNNRLEFQKRWTDVQIIKKRLLNNGTPEQKRRMLNREIREASESFNFGMYDLAERLYGEIYNRYQDVGLLDDCLYYKGEANYALGRYNEAEEDLKLLLQQYPSSQYIPDAYKKIMYINYHFGRYDAVFQYLDRMQAIVASSDPALEESRFLGVIAGLKSGRYDQTISLGFEIPANSEYYRETRFTMAEAYAGAGNFDESLKILSELFQKPGIDPQFRSLLLLKMGYINYELGNYTAAISYFDLIPGDYPNYDRVLIGYGWAYYKRELLKDENEPRDFTYARKNLELLIDVFYGSDYFLEAKTLLGYIYQLEQKADKAVQNFEYAFESKQLKQFSDEMNTERDQLIENYQTTDDLAETALEKGNVAAFTQAYNTKKKIKKPLDELTLSDLSSAGMSTRNEINRLNEKLAELDALKEVARDRGRKDIVNRIDDMQLKIYRAVNSISQPESSEFGFNYFDDHPFARKESMLEHENEKILNMREEIEAQRNEIMERISKLDVEIENAGARRDYKRMINLEISKERFQNILKKMDRMQTRAYAFNVKPSNINLNKWSNYGAFGVANVNFAVKQQKEAEITRMLDHMDQINRVLETRKMNVEHQIGQINREITLMTRRVREQERRREREEMKRRFEESYFDTHDSELDYNPDTTKLPKINEQ